MLFDAIGERELIGEKEACRLARLIEEDFITAGWPTGQNYGSAKELSQHFGVSRPLVREAVRILESRGTARMVRGPRGGLKVLTPPMALIFEYFSTYCHLIGVNASHLVDLQSLLRRVARQIRLARSRRPGQPLPLRRLEEVALRFFTDLIEHLKIDCALQPGMAGSLSLVSRDVAQRSRAGQIVGRLTATYSAEEWARGTRLGSEEDLCGRHSTNREVFRQAVRILESFGAARTDCGRGNGLSSRRPNSTAASRLIACYFASQQLGLDEANFLFQALSQEAAALAAQRASEQDDLSIEDSLAGLQAALNGENDDDAMLAALYRCEQSLFASIANPLLDVILQAARCYPSCWLPSRMGTTVAIIRSFLELSGAVQSAVRARDPRAAWQAQARKTNVLTDLFLPLVSVRPAFQVPTSFLDRAET